jgi:hypothetical protein
MLPHPCMPSSKHNSSPCPCAGSNGATANAAFMALMYADMIKAESADTSHVYKCWGLSQVRYMLGDAGHSLVVGAGHGPPKRTQDRAAGCPAPPQVCPCCPHNWTPESKPSQTPGVGVPSRLPV